MDMEDICNWFAGCFSHCFLLAEQPAVRSKLGTDEQHAITPCPQQQDPIFFQAPEQMEILESSVSAASIVFRGTGSSILSSSFCSSSVCSGSFCVSNPSSIMENMDSYSSEKPLTDEEASVAAVPGMQFKTSAAVLAVEPLNFKACTLALGAQKEAIDACTAVLCTPRGETTDVFAEPEQAPVQQDATEASSATALCVHQAQALATSLLDAQQDEVEALEAARLLREEQEELEIFDNPLKERELPKEVKERMNLVVQQLKDWIVMDQVALRQVERHLTVPRRYWL